MAGWLSWRPLENDVGVKMLWAVVVFGLATIVFGFSKWMPLSLVALLIVAQTTTADRPATADPPAEVAADPTAPVDLTLELGDFLNLLFLLRDELLGGAHDVLALAEPADQPPEVTRDAARQSGAAVEKLERPWKPRRPVTVLVGPGAGGDG